MTGQLDRLLALMSLPAVSLGVIPASGERRAMAQGSFWMFDEERVAVETISAGLDITQPAEIRLYGTVFEMLRNSAVFGHGARELITGTLASLVPGNSANLRQHP
ncbi:MAG: Scr1 family TA system antitoxin-like transcriptional regulator [Streptosporangiaceae bacterium]